MANLTQNLELLRLGKQNLIDKINTKLIDSDKEILSIDCEWEDVINLLSKIRVKRDHSAEIDTNAIYTDLCEGTFNTEIVTAVTTIMPYAMYGQTYLPKITGENATSIGTYAFCNCENLTDAIFPEVTTVDSYAFQNCSKLDNTDFSKITYIGTAGFNNCGFEHISIPKIITINESSFSGCKNLKTIELNSENTYTIGNYAFDNCESLETDVTANATSIGQYAIRKTKIVSLESPIVTSIETHGIENNPELEQINFANVTSITARFISSNPNLQSVLLPKLKSLSGSFYDNAKLSVIYMPEINYISYSVNNAFNSCPMLTSISLPNATFGSYYNGYVYSNGGIAYSCANLENIDLSGIIRYGDYYGNYMLNNCPKLTSVNLSNLKTCYEKNINSYYSNYSGGCARYFNLMYKIGASTISLPSLVSINPYTRGVIAEKCYNLTTLALPNLEKLLCYQNSGNYINIVNGCPNLAEIELPQLTTIWRGRTFAGYEDVAAQKAYAESWIDYIKYRFPDDYENMDCYKAIQETLHGPIINQETGERDPFSTNYAYSSIYLNELGLWWYNDVNRTYNWCGLKKINLPKLSSWAISGSNSIFYWTTELEEIVLGDGSFAPSSSLSSYFCNNCWKLRKVVLNYPSVVTASTSLDSIFYQCPHLTGDKYQTTAYSGAYWYYANSEGLKDLYFYVPDDLVDSYKAATNWSAYASQIRPISELSDTVIDSSITEIEDEAYKNNQELNTIAGYGITTIGTETFYNSSVTRAEFPSAENISSYAFAECQSLAKVILAFSKTTTIAEGTFKNTALTEANYQNVITINKQAFYGCQDLSSISIPKCEIIYDDAFNSANLAVLNASELKTIGNNAFKNNSLESLTLPKIVTIGNNAFEDNVLTNLSLDTLTIIGNEAFKNNNLTNIAFANLTSIGANAFEDNNITSVSIPRIAIIKDSAFKDNTNLASINLASVVALGSNVFNGCSSLTDITFEGYIVPTVGENTIKSTYILHVRPEMLDDFQEAFPNNTVVGDVS